MEAGTEVSSKVGGSGHDSRSGGSGGVDAPPYHRFTKGDGFVHLRSECGEEMEVDVIYDIEYPSVGYRIVSRPSQFGTSDGIVSSQIGSWDDIFGRVTIGSSGEIS